MAIFSLRTNSCSSACVAVAFAATSTYLAYDLIEVSSHPIAALLGAGSCARSSRTFVVTTEGQNRLGLGSKGYRGVPSGPEHIKPLPSKEL
jgi:hypothetical protein